MSSIIKYFKAKKLAFLVSSSDPALSSYGPYNVIADNGENLFQTQTAPYYWQISFSHTITIKSYIISGESIRNNTMTSWEISYSLDGSNFTNLQTDVADDIRKNTEKFPLVRPISCVHFKITGVSNTAGNSHLFFRRFDCFGALKRINIMNSCNIAYVKRMLIANELISIMIMCISK